MGEDITEVVLEFFMWVNYRSNLMLFKFLLFLKLIFLLRSVIIGLYYVIIFFIKLFLSFCVIDGVRYF